jgi:hypothetical protein
MGLNNKRSFLADKKALVRLSVGFFVIATIVSVVVFASGVLANTHDSTATVNPDLVQASTPYNFIVTIASLPSSGDPISEFRIYMESFGSNPNPFTDIVCKPKSGWNGPFIISSSEGDYCLYTATNAANRIGPGQSQDFNFDAKSPATGSCRTFKFETRDPDQFWRPIQDEVCVDNQAPITAKHFEGPQKIKDGVEWIDGVSKVVLVAEDPQPHPAGVKKTSYKLSGPVDNKYCYNVCQDWQKSSPDSGGWSEYTSPLENIAESCHVLEFYSTDKLGNVEDIKTNCFFVDKTPPIITKKVGEPKIAGGDTEFDYFVSSETPITLTCEDQAPHPSNDVTIYYKYRVDTDGDGFGDESWKDTVSQKTGELTFRFPEASLHELEYWCIDAVGKESTHLFEKDKVDNEAPVITKTMIGKNHLGACPPRPNSEDKCYVADNRANGVHISVEDPSPLHASNNVQCAYELWWNDKNLADNPNTFGTEGKDIIFKEDSTHTLKVWCQDGLGNKVEDIEKFLVDSTPPTTTKTYVGPQYPNPIIEGTTPYPHWIAALTTVNLKADDTKVGVDKTYYRTTKVENKYCETFATGECVKANVVGEFIEYADPFTMEQSCHVIDFYSVDKLGNKENTKRQCVFIDTTAPKSNKVIGKPQIQKDDGLYISQQTPITFTCTDQQPHPVDHNSLWYRYRVSNDCVNYGEWTKWIDPELTTQIPGKTIYFPEDSCHQLEYYCKDALGNAEQVQSETDIVDTKAPKIGVEVTGPKYCPDTEGPCYIDLATKIVVSAEDPTPHPVGGVTCDWSYTVNNGEVIPGSSGLTSPFTINSFPEESDHKLFITCQDALGNKNTITKEFLVDHTAPGIHKKYGNYQYSYDFMDYKAEWINSKTPIYITVTDDGVHKSGINKVEYRTSRVDDEYCKNYYQGDKFACQDAQGTGNWITGSQEFVFNILEQSCHLIEIVATDNVGKSSTHKQCVFVDNTAPEPSKTVGEIKTIWDGKDGTFYKDETAHCWEKNQAGELVGIECWKVTMDTPITLDCQDPLPHPVDHESTCFQVGLDGDDATQNYCDRLKGSYDSASGYCCGFNAPYTFSFKEESEHNLKFYCEDALGNKGNVDEEKFKVFGKMWKIPIYKKWNLISVPFDPINKDVVKVFSEIEKDVDAVWTYDGDDKKWYVYRPGVNDGDDTNNLDKINTGVGYWVLALADHYAEGEELVIGGGLLSPGPVLPPSNNLEKGWNLIGHYGTDPKIGKPAYCSLYSLIDTNMGYPRWSALFGYDALSDSFKGLNPWDLTKPGKGYWVEMDVNDSYSPATLCWNFIL